jgi:predicted Zn-dependent protease
VTADLALISEHLRRKEVDEALKAIDGLEKKQPANPLAAQLRAQALMSNNDRVELDKTMNLPSSLILFTTQQLLDLHSLICSTKSLKPPVSGLTRY